MAPFHTKKVPLLLCLLLVFLTSTLISAHSQHKIGSSRRRMLLEIEDEENVPVVKKKSTSSSSSSSSSGNKISTKTNNTKLLKPMTTIPNSSKNQTKLIKTTSLKNQTKLIKPSNSTTLLKPQQTKKLNTTTSVSKKPTSDLSKPKPNSPQLKKTVGESISKANKAQKKPNWIDDDEDDDLVSEFRDLPSKFQESIMPDLERISETSRTYLTKYNKEFTKGFKPYVGNKYASSIASFVSFAFIIIPLILVSLLFNRIKAFFSLLKLLIFIQIYLAIYFTILCFSSLVTGLEPLKFFYSTSQSTYICVQVLQTLGYVLYLLLLLMFLVLVFSTESGIGTKVLGLGQTLVGFAVGLHYYMTVFHRAVLRQAPKTSWKVHGIYATCFLAVCLLGKLDRSKKAYLEEGGEEGKKS